MNVQVVIYLQARSPKSEPALVSAKMDTTLWLFVKNQFSMEEPLTVSFNSVLIKSITKSPYMKDERIITM